MSFLDIFKALKFKRENEELHLLFEKINATEAIEVQKRINELKQERELLVKSKEQYQNDLNDLSKLIFQKKSEIIVLDEELLLESFSLYKPKFTFLTSDEYKNRLDTIRTEQKQMIKMGLAATGSQNWTVNNSKSEGKKMVNDMIKLLLRSFNNECDYCIDNVKFNNIESFKNRIEKSFEVLNKLGRITEVSINSKYRDSKIEELNLSHEYQQTKQEEKERAKEERERLREEQKVAQEIKIARERLLKDRNQYTRAIKNNELKLKNVSTEKERESILKENNEFYAKLADLDKEETVLDYREKNAKAGFVYVISNLGAFGDNVYKIGMTRRLEPNERIDELGNASVPFSFDVHTMFFQEDAPKTESELHRLFFKNRINKLNNRKEFFRVDINEIEKEIIKIKSDVNFIKEFPAEQYRESLRIE